MGRQLIRNTIETSSRVGHTRTVMKWIGNRNYSKMRKLEFYYLLYILVSASLDVCEGGSCWSSVKNRGQCGQLLRRGVTFEQCCESNDKTHTANRFVYSDRDAKDSRQLFFLVFINRPSICRPCPNPCNGMRCGVNSRIVCTFTKTRKARCVCNPDCSNTFAGKVCSTDQKTYSKECELLTEGCHSRKEISIDYYSECKDSCDSVKCPKDKLCVEDQYRVPHCVSNIICKTKCETKPDDEKLCGTNGVTYANLCALRKVVCKRGKGERIGIAYKGVCKRFATCNNVKCAGRNKCLNDGNSVRCVKCQSFCIGGFHIYKPVCGMDGKTYKNWCSLRHAACNSGKHIEVKKNGKC